MSGDKLSDPGDLFAIMQKIEPGPGDIWIKAFNAGINPDPGDVWFTDGVRQSQTCRLIDYDAFQIVGGVANGTWFLIVEGEKPNQLVDVELRPVTYVVRPDYWEIEVLGCLSPEASDLRKRYQAKIDITAHLGTRGIALVSRKGAQEIDWPPG
jgi:hypothetical protein